MAKANPQSYIGHKLFLNPGFSDFKIICEGQEFPCHKAILSVNSTYFEALLRSNFKESHTNEIEIKEAKAEDVREMIRYIYTGCILEESASASLLILADRFNLELLMIIIMTWLQDRLIKTRTDFEIVNAAEVLVDEYRDFVLYAIASTIRTKQISKEIWQKNISVASAEFIEKFINLFTKDFQFHWLQSIYNAIKFVNVFFAETEEVQETLLVHGFGIPGHSRKVQVAVFSPSWNKIFPFVPHCLSLTKLEHAKDYIDFLKTGKIHEKKIDMGLMCLIAMGGNSKVTKDLLTHCLRKLIKRLFRQVLKMSDTLLFCVVGMLRNAAWLNKTRVFYETLARAVHLERTLIYEKARHEGFWYRFGSRFESGKKDIELVRSYFEAMVMPYENEMKAKEEKGKMGRKRLASIQETLQSMTEDSETNPKSRRV